MEWLRDVAYPATKYDEHSCSIQSSSSILFMSYGFCELCYHKLSCYIMDIHISSSVIWTWYSLSVLKIAAERPRFDITSPTKYKATQIQGIITIDLMLKTQFIEFRIFLVNICHCYAEINFMLGSNAFIRMMTCPIMLYTNPGSVGCISPHSRCDMYLLFDTTTKNANI